MESLKAVLLDHAARYPLMEPTDAVKLIYQNEFGGGHLLRSKQMAYSYLLQEYASVEKCEDAMLLEDIGNGLARVHLAALKEQDLQPLMESFAASAQVHQGSLPIFLKKLCLLRELAESGVFSFGAEALGAYLKAYESAGFPMVSHSESYRAAYRPAYRIVRREFLWIE